VQGLIASPSGAWTSGAAVLTAVFPMVLFIAVAGALYVLYTKPETVPGHSVGPVERPVSYTAVPGPAQVAPGPVQAQAARAEGATRAEGAPSAEGAARGEGAARAEGDATAGDSSTEAAGTEDAE
jgi:hypothetical protein